MNLIAGHTLLDEWGLDYFTSASCLGALSEAAVVYLLTQGRIQELETGERLFSLGERGDNFYILLKGAVNFYRPRHNQLTLIHRYGFGTPIGYVSLIGLHNRTGQAQAAEPSVVLQIDCDLFARLQIEFAEDFSILLLNLSREMARTLRIMGDLLAEQGIENPAP